MDEVTVIKLNERGEETWRYSGIFLERSDRGVLIEARFNREDVPFHGVLLRQGDLFVEAYYRDRWYNIFEIHDRDTMETKGWYCNVTCPAQIADGEIRYVDLALDLLVYPDGRQLVLDEDEFEQLEINDATRSHALAAISELQSLLKPHKGFILQV